MSSTSRTAGGAAVAALALTLVVLVLAAAPARAGGYGHGYGHGGHRAGSGVSLGFTYYRGGYRGRHRLHRHHRGSGVRFAWYGPLYLPPPVVYAAAPPVVIVDHGRHVARALPDMPDFRYEPLAGQDAARLTSDRRACERSAWRASRRGPATGATLVTRTVRRVPVSAYPGSPLPQAAGGALLGAVGGAIGGDAGLGAAIGAAVGATSWLLGAASAPPTVYQQQVVSREYVPPAGPDPRALRATLMACMESRDYAVR